MSFKPDISAALVVAACERAIDKEGKPRATREGKPIYQILVVVARKQKVGAKEIEVKDFETLTSEIELKPSDKPVHADLEQYAMYNDHTKRVDLYYRVKAIR